jgi:hypothetical protein
MFKPTFENGLEGRMHSKPSSKFVHSLRARIDPPRAIDLAFERPFPDRKMVSSEELALGVRLA